MLSKSLIRKAGRHGKIPGLHPAMRVEAIILPRFLHTFHQWKSMGLAAWATQANTDKRKTTNEPFRFCYSSRWNILVRHSGMTYWCWSVLNKAQACKVYHRQIPDRWECCIWKGADQ